jgi:guanylate kinase
MESTTTLFLKPILQICRQRVTSWNQQKFMGTTTERQKKWVDSQLTLGRDIILEIDWQGARQIRTILPGACSIFILPPSLEALTQRLQGRGQDDIGTIKDRMQEAQSVITHVSEADFVIVNDEFETALQDINAIIKTQRLNARNQEKNLKGLIKILTRR